MKRIIILVFLITGIFYAFAFQNEWNSEGEDVFSKRLIKRIKKGMAYLVDVRTPEEYNNGHLKYSRNVDFNSGNFNKQISQLDKTKPVYVYCRTGNRSAKAIDSLKALGFRMYYNIGGFEELKNTGFPTE